MKKNYYRNICKKCFNSEPKTNNSGRILLTDFQISEIQRRYLNNETLRSIVVSVGVSKSSVSKYVQGLTRIIPRNKPRRPIVVGNRRKRSPKSVSEEPMHKFVLFAKPKPKLVPRKSEYPDYFFHLQDMLRDKDHTIVKYPQNPHSL